MTTREIGNIGEDYTADFLKYKGCTILERNFTVRGGEIDIIARKGNVLHFVEVKSRKKNPLSTGTEAVTERKIQHIIKAASEYIQRNEIELSCIFDVAVVEIDGGRVTDFKYIQRAFNA